MHSHRREVGRGRRFVGECIRFDLKPATPWFKVRRCVSSLLILMLLGGLFQDTVARGPGRRFIYRIGKFIGLTPQRLDVMMARVRKGGSAAVALGLTMPGLRIATTPASGLADLPRAATC